MLNAAPVKLAPLSVGPPTINATGSAGVAKTVSNTAVILINGDLTRKKYNFVCTQDVMCEWGDTLNGAPATTPTSSVGYLYKANIPYTELDIPGLRMDCIRATSSDASCYTEEVF